MANDVVQRATLSEIKEYVKAQLDAFVTERVPHAASLALKTAITFLGTAIGVFLRELINNPEFKQMIENRTQEEINAALRAALQELWNKTYDLFFATFKRNIGTGILEANYFAEHVMNFMGDGERKKERQLATPVVEETSEQTAVGAPTSPFGWLNLKMKE